MNKIPSKFLIPGVILGIVALALIVLIVKNTSNGGGRSASSVTSISVASGENKVSVDISGNVVWQIEGKNSSALWDRSKTQSFFDYIFTTYGVTDSVTANANDELINQVMAEGSGSSSNNSSGSGSSGGGGNIANYFESPTPMPSGGAGGSGNGGSGGSGNNGGGSGGGGIIPDWCIHWKLSYCADTPPPSYSQTPSPVPTNGPTPLPPDCNNPGNQQTGRTVIGNELCLPSPTP